MSDIDYEVVIVGLGPTGLALANLLGRCGTAVLVLEREPECYGPARAVYTDDEGLRIFQTAGVADELAADMNVDSTVQWVRGNGKVLVQFSEREHPLGWPVSNFLIGVQPDRKGGGSPPLRRLCSAGEAMCRALWS